MWTSSGHRASVTPTQSQCINLSACNKNGQLVTSLPTIYGPAVALLHFYVNYRLFFIFYFKHASYFKNCGILWSRRLSFSYWLHFWRNTRTYPSNSEDLESAQPTSSELIPTFRRKVPLSQIHYFQQEEEKEFPSHVICAGWWQPFYLKASIHGTST